MEQIPSVKDKVLQKCFNETRQQLANCRGRLENPRFIELEVGVSRLLFNVMHRDLVTEQGKLHKFNDEGDEGMIAGKTPAGRWLEKCKALAASMTVQLLTPSEMAVREKGQREYESMALKMLTNDKYATQMMIDKSTANL